MNTHKTKTVNNYEDAHEPDSGFEYIKSHAQTIGWGEPAIRCEVKMDKVCHRCGKTQAQGFELSINADGSIDAYCDCGFSL